MATIKGIDLYNYYYTSDDDDDDDDRIYMELGVGNVRSKSKLKERDWMKRRILISLIVLTTVVTFAVARCCRNNDYIFDKLRHSQCNDVVISDFNRNGEVDLSKDAYHNFFSENIELKRISSQLIDRKDFNEWLIQQHDVSLFKTLSNVMDKNLYGDVFSGNGDDVKEGVIVASPSMDDPNYFFQWVRDSGIVINSVIDNLFDEQDFNLTLVGTFLKYLNTSQCLQRIDNMSGGSAPEGDLKGLGEPKWNVNNTPFNGDWGRPQNDGSPLRIISILNFYSELYSFNERKGTNFTLDDLILKYHSKYTNLQLPFANEQEIFDQIMYYDIRYILDNWKQENFDLWEEVYGVHFFTSLVQLTSIRMTVNYMKKKEWSEGINSIDNKHLSLLQEMEDVCEEMCTYMLIDAGFVSNNGKKQFIVETPKILDQRSGLDIAVIIGSLFSHPTNHQFLDQSLPFGINDSGVLNTLYYLISEMSTLYPINAKRKNLNMGVALGRYPEDIYDGHRTSEGNPWFLSTSYAAQILYRLILKIKSNKQDLIIPLTINDNFNTKNHCITNDENIFWTLILDNIQINKPHHFPNDKHNSNQMYQLILPYNSKAFQQTLETLFKYADSFLDCIREHSSKEGNLSEQYNKYTGFLQGAQDLTWSHSSFLSTFKIRNKVLSTVFQ